MIICKFITFIIFIFLISKWRQKIIHSWTISVSKPHPKDEHSNNSVWFMRFEFSNCISKVFRFLLKFKMHFKITICKAFLRKICLKRRKVRRKNFKQNAASFCVVRMNIHWIAFKHLWEKKIIYLQSFYHCNIKDWKNNPYAYHWRTVIFPLFKL